MVASAGIAEEVFPVGSCERCGRLVLAYPALLGQGRDQYRCVHCDHAVVLDESVPFAALESLGYGYLTDAPGAGGKCADGSPCPVPRQGEGEGGCGAGGCGAGGCGSQGGGSQGGGCGAGSCGAGGSGCG